MKETALLILLLFVTNSYSQDKKNNFQFSIGTTSLIPKKHETFSSNNSENFTFKSKISLGFYLLPSINHSFNKKTSIDFGLGFFIDRAEIDYKYYYFYKNSRNLSQIQTPININYHFGKNNSYLLGIGGFSSYLVSATIKGNRINNLPSNSRVPATNPDNSSYNYNYDIRDNYNLFHFGSYIQLKKKVSFSNKTRGFLLLKFNQYFGTKKDNYLNDQLRNENLTIDNLISNDEKEPMSINLGIGIEL